MCQLELPELNETLVRDVWIGREVITPFGQTICKNFPIGNGVARLAENLSKRRAHLSATDRA
jgi:hypothetical protein